MATDLFTNKQMEGMSPQKQAKRAIQHTLQQCLDNPQLAWYINIGSQSFSLLTEAAATLFNEPVEKIRRAFANKEAVDVQSAYFNQRSIAHALTQFHKNLNEGRSWDAAASGFIEDVEGILNIHRR